MKIELGKCLKCNAEIIRDRKPTPLWTQRAYKLNNDKILWIALCSNCSLTPDDYAEASALCGVDAPIISATGDVDTLKDILKDNQNGKCFYCDKPIGENYAISGGHISCERC